MAQLEIVTDAMRDTLDILSDPTLSDSKVKRELTDLASSFDAAIRDLASGDSAPAAQEQTETETKGD